MAATHHFRQGFTLLELSIVLVIIALVTGMAVTAGVSVVETARLTSTQTKMKAIDTALMQYRTANDRVPCPSDLTLAPGSANYGLEAGAGAGSAIATGTGVCTGTGMLPAANFTGAGATNTFQTAAEGAVPAVTLGLSPDFMIDGWGNQFRYAVDISYTVPAAFAINGVRCTNGAITVNDSNGNARSTGSVYALISHGANGHGAYTRNGIIQNAGSMNANELINCHCNSSGTPTTYAPTYVQMQQTLDPINSLDNFDDLVTQRQRWQMQTSWDSTRGCAYVYVSDIYTGNRVEIFNSSGTYVGQVGCPGTTGCAGAGGSGGTNGQFYNLNGVAVDAYGNLWAANGYSLEEFNTSNAYVGAITSGYISYPFGLAIDLSGNFWMSDYNGNLVEKWNSSGNYVLTIPPSCAGGVCYNSISSAQGYLNRPFGLAVDLNGNVWVADTGNNRVEEFSSTGTFIQQLGCASGTCATGSGNGQLNGPCGVAVDAGNNIWVTDVYNQRVEEFNNTTGAYEGQFGTPGVGGSSWFSPFSIAIDTLGNFWVTDEYDNDVLEFNKNGVYQRTFGSPGTGPGQFGGFSGIAAVR